MVLAGLPKYTSILFVVPLVLIYPQKRYERIFSRPYFAAVIALA
jgi:hypothetical protein